MPTNLYGYKKDPAARHPLDRNAHKLLGVAPAAPAAWSDRSLADFVLQQQLQDCWAHVAAEAFVKVAKVQGIELTLPSRLALYRFARAESGDDKVDSGSYPGLGWDAAEKLGFGPEFLWPYEPRATELAHDGSTVERWLAMPSTEYFAAAYREVGIEKYRITDTGDALVEAIKCAISGRHAYTFGIDVTQAFEEQDGKRPMPPPDPSQIIGGHALIGDEYDAGGVRGRSSWGEGFGDGGWYYLSWAAMVQNATDHWVITGVPRNQGGVA